MGLHFVLVEATYQESKQFWCVRNRRCKVIALPVTLINSKHSEDDCGIAAQ